MNYQPYLIANYATSLDKELQPWLLPDDAQSELFDGFVYRGVWQKRQGYNYYATGVRSGSPYTESRIVVHITNEATGQTNTGVVLANITLLNPPVRRGSVTVSDGVESHTDDGLGTFPTATAGSIDYVTAIISGFQFNAASGNPVVVTYDYFPGLPVMMIANYFTTSSTNQMIVADTRNVNKYNPTTNLLEFVTKATTLTGTNFNFFSWTNYPDANDSPRLLFSNYADPVQSYNGTTVTDWAFTSATITVLKALHIFYFKDRLVLLNTVETVAGPVTTRYPKRIRVTGFGANADILDSTAPGAGFIDIPDNTQIVSAAFNRDDLLIFTENSTWALKYTGNDVRPFDLYKLDDSRGSGGPYSSISYLSRTTTASRRGLIITDGYRVDRMDNKLPDFSYNEINQKNFALAYAGTVDEDRDNYLIYPSSNVAKSDRILITNYEEDNFCIYRIPLSSMGNFIESFTVTWNDLLQYDNWDEFANDYQSWNNFGFGENTPIAIGGGHNGQIWRLNIDEFEDNPLRVRNIVYPNVNDPTLIDVTTDFNNYSVGDYIFFENIGGLVEINNKQYPIISRASDYTFTVRKSTNGTDAYTSGGQASRVIPFETKTKNFNPFANADKKVRCGWLYFYVTTSSTFLTKEDGSPEEAIINVEVFVNDNEQPTQVLNFNVSPYDANATNLTGQVGIKKWCKLWINQTATFITFKIVNIQAGSKIKIHAMMPGFAPVGRLV